MLSTNKRHVSLNATTLRLFCSVLPKRLDCGPFALWGRERGGAHTHTHSHQHTTQIVMSVLSDLRTGSSLVESLPWRLVWDRARERSGKEAKTSYSYVLHDLQGGVVEVDVVSMSGCDSA